MFQSKIKQKQRELRRDFGNCCRQMRLKWFFRDERKPSFSETINFKTKISWNLPKGHPYIVVY